jgi:hypothetical protein
MISHVKVEDWKQWKDKVVDKKLDDGGFLSSSAHGVMVLPPVALTEKKTSRRKLREYENLRDNTTSKCCVVNTGKYLCTVPHTQMSVRGPATERWGCCWLC